MYFNSISFLVFLSLFTVLHFSAKDAKKQVDIAIAGSYFFYLSNGLLSTVFLGLVTIVTYTGIILLTRKTTNGKTWLVLAILLILLMWVVSNYTFLVYDKMAPNYEVRFLKIIGISFYSLQVISLLVDVYRNRYLKPLTLRQIALFLSFFPQAVSGPIHRADELIPQFFSIKKFSSISAYKGCRLILFGFLFKLIVADKIGLIIDPVFNNIEDYNGLSVFISMHLYSLQIYFDFWGYSLIAIGVGQILGYSLKINFNYPYSVSSFKLFWRRWHISLSQWMRDYVYIPLGGNKKQSLLIFFLIINLTFLASAIWHGLTINFILWGCMHAALYFIENLGRKYIKNSKRFIKISQIRITQILRKIIFLNLISCTWLIFRTEKIEDLKAIVRFILKFENWTFSSSETVFNVPNIIYFLLAILIVLLSKKIITPLQTVSTIVYSNIWKKYWDFTLITGSILLLFLFGDIGNREFLYFNF